MLNTEDFISKLEIEGYSHICVVPCSFAKNLINALINSSDRIEYLPCASEAVACSIASGLKIAGKKPIVIVQSSGLTNMGSCITSLLLPYEIRFPIIVSWRTYKEGDSEVQHKHLATKLPDLIDSYGYSHITLDRNSITNAIDQIKESEIKHQICLLSKETFSRVVLNKELQLDLSRYSKRSEYLKILNKEFKNTGTIFIGTTGNTAREMYTFMPDTNNLYMAGNMGGALSVGLGMTKAGNKVIVCGGDAEFVMHMGGITTAGRYRNIDLTYIVFDNESNKSTGGQKTYQDHVDYGAISGSSGILSNTKITEVSQFQNAILKSKNTKQLNTIIVKCDYDDVVPRPPIEIVKNTSIFS